jgi:hypothetical protein
MNDVKDVSTRLKKLRYYTQVQTISIFVAPISIGMGRALKAAINGTRLIARHLLLLPTTQRTYDTYARAGNFLDSLPSLRNKDSGTVR